MKNKRKWCYNQNPAVYDIKCDKCNGINITWSEYEHMIWCYDCKIDTKGTGGIFDGPIPMGLCALMGIGFDRLYLDDMSVVKMTDKDDKIIYEE